MGQPFHELARDFYRLGFAAPTRKKSLLAPTAPFEPTPGHRRRWDAPSRTTPLCRTACSIRTFRLMGEKRNENSVKSAGAVRWIAISDHASGSRSPGADELLETWTPFASVSRTTKLSEPDRLRDRCTARLGSENPPSGSRIKTQRMGTAGSPVEYQMAVSEMTSTARSPPPYQLLTVIGVQAVFGPQPPPRGSPGARPSGEAFPSGAVCVAEPVRRGRRRA